MVALAVVEMENIVHFLPQKDDGFGFTVGKLTRT